MLYDHSTLVALSGMADSQVEDSRHTEKLTIGKTQYNQNLLNLRILAQLFAKATEYMLETKADINYLTSVIN